MQGFRERETVAEIQKIGDARPLSRILSDMEMGISDLRGWGMVIQAFGTCPNEVAPEALHVVGRVLLHLAAAQEKDWEGVRTLTRTVEDAR